VINFVHIEKVIHEMMSINTAEAGHTASKNTAGKPSKKNGGQV